MKHMKKSIILIGILFVACCFAALCLTPSKAYAENITVEAQSFSWEITEDGVLHISGEGIIPNNYQPWGANLSIANKVTSIVLEEGITRIGAGAISRKFSNVETIVFPSTLKEIGGSNFINMQSLVELSLPEHLESIEDDCFQDCDALKNIIFPNSLTLIGRSCFLNCNSLENIFIPASVKEIGVGSFTQNNSLKELKIAPQNTAYVIEDGILYDHERKTLMLYPLLNRNSTFSVPDTIETIGMYAFSCSNYLEEIRIPSGIKRIEFSAFSECSNLQKINLPSNLISLSDATFQNCTKLKNIEIPYGMTHIGSFAFSECPIENIIIPDSVTYIGSRAFSPTTIISCTKDSYADQFAQKNGYNIFYFTNHSQVYECSGSTEQMKQWKKASTEFLEFIIKHLNDDKSTFTHFVGIMIDDRYVAPENYTALPGSLILRLKASYLETLSLGEHTLKVIFDDGEIEIPFEVSDEPVKPEVDAGAYFRYVVIPSDSFTFKKVWQGDHEDSIDFTLYKADGSVYHHGFDKKVLSKTEWRYNAYFSSPAACYVIEKPVPGYQIKYVNVGVYADVTDRCCDGGTIINKKIPKTGDTADFALWAGIIALGIVGLTTTVILTKRKKAHK